MKKHTLKTVIFLLMVSIPLYASTRAKIISKKGRWLTVNKGSQHGVKTGMKGKVKMDIVDGGTRYDINIGLFTVKTVYKQASSLYLDRIGSGAKTADAQYVIFNDTLKKPVSDKTVRITGGKTVEWYLEKGDALFRQRQYKEAKSYYQMVINIDKLDPVAKIKIDECDKKLELLKEEQKFYQYIEKAEVYLRKKSIRYALNYYLGAFHIYPSGKKIIAHKIQKIALEHQNEFAAFQKSNFEVLETIMDDSVLSPDVIAVLSGLVPFDKDILKKAQKAQKNIQGYWEIGLKSGATLIYIPQGNFSMGSGRFVNIKTGSQEESAQAKGFQVDVNETPQHEVSQDGFFIGKFELSNQEFIKFLNQAILKVFKNIVSVNGKSILKMYPTQQDTIQYNASNDKNKLFYIDDRFATHPVVNVTLVGAEMYCEWLTKKTGLQFRLPTEAQWEKAARGTDKRIFPWGNHFPELKNTYYANYSQGISVSDGFTRTAPVSSMAIGASPYGAFNMGGNVSEWVADWYAREFYQKSTKKNPFNSMHRESIVSGLIKGKNAGIVRGGSWKSKAIDLRVSSRDKRKRSKYFIDVGFRVAIPSS